MGQPNPRPASPAVRGARRPGPRRWTGRPAIDLGQAAFEILGELPPWRKLRSEDIRRRVADSLTLRYIPTSEDVAEAALFLALASRRTRGITGAALDINAGEYVPL